MALWGGRFEKGVDAFTQEFGASLNEDKAMAQQDIAGSRAHAKMLAEQGIISEDDQAAIDAGLAEISGQIERGEFEWDVNDEDIHMAVEGALRATSAPRVRACTPAVPATTRWRPTSAFMPRSSASTSSRATTPFAASSSTLPRRTWAS